MPESDIQHFPAIAPSFPLVTPSGGLPRIGPGSAGVSMTPDEFDAITDYDDDWRYELIHGVLVVNPIPSDPERDQNGELEFLLRLYERTHPTGSALDATLSEAYVHLPNSRRRADRVIWAGLGRLPDTKADVPAIVVEFVSKGKRSWNRDYVEKKQDYLALGVKEYWVIDRFERKLTVFRSSEPFEIAVAADGVYRTDLLPGFELPLAELLAAGDRWASEGEE